MLSLFARFPLMFRFVHERQVASLRFDIEQLQKFTASQTAFWTKHSEEWQKLCDSYANDSKKQLVSHTAALKALDAAYQKDKAGLEKMYRSPWWHNEAGYAVLPFATFRQQAVTYG